MGILCAFFLLRIIHFDCSLYFLIRSQVVILKFSLLIWGRASWWCFFVGCLMTPFRLFLISWSTGHFSFSIKALLLSLYLLDLYFRHILSRRLGEGEVGGEDSVLSEGQLDSHYQSVLGGIQFPNAIFSFCPLVHFGPGRYWDVWSRLLFLTTWCLVSGIFVFLLRF